MKIMASDFDGTLFFSFIGEGKGFKEGDLKAIDKFRKEGHKFGVCTGRPLLGISSQCDGKVDFDFYITSSGAAILNEKRETIYEKTISFETMKKIAEEFVKVSTIWVHVNHVLYVNAIADSIKFKQIVVDSFDEIPKEHIHSISFELKDEDEAEKACKYIDENYPDCTGFRNDRFVDIVARGVSKGNTLKEYAKLCNAETTIGIGDNYNDITLLEGSNISYTFHHSPKAVQKKAMYLVNSVEEAIEEIMK